MIGFHAAYNVQEDRKVESGVANALLGAYLSRIGLPDRAVIYITKASPSSMTWLDLEHARAVGIDATPLDDSPNNAPQEAPRPRVAGPPGPGSVTAKPRPAVPQFASYPVAQVYTGPNAQPILDTPRKHAYRTRLRAAAAMKPDFAGEYVVATWGCGTACIAGAVVNVRTGRVTFLPGSVSGWGAVDTTFEPVERRVGSSLIVLAGMINEQEPLGAHFYLFDGTTFRHIHTVLMDPEFKNPL